MPPLYIYIYINKILGYDCRCLSGGLEWVYVFLLRNLGLCYSSFLGRKLGLCWMCICSRFPLDYGLIWDWSRYGVFDGCFKRKQWLWTQCLWKRKLSHRVLLLKEVYSYCPVKDNVEWLVRKKQNKIIYS